MGEVANHMAVEAAQVVVATTRAAKAAKAARAAAGKSAIRLLTTYICARPCQ